MQVQAGIYRHYKGPEYRVLGLAHHTETDETMVVYQLMYKDFDLGVRPLTSFLESVEVDGERVPRFSLIKAEPARFGQSRPYDELLPQA